MKSTVLVKSTVLAAIVAMAALSPVPASASTGHTGVSDGDPVYVKSMEEAILGLSSSKSANDYLRVINQFERISSVNPQDWLSVYWATYAYTLASYAFTDATTKDQYLEKAEQLAKKLNVLKPNNDEVVVLEAFLAQSRMSVDPQNRFMTYGAKFNELIAKARKMNPDNPRIYNLQGRSLYYTPENFGGGKTTACPVIAMAVEKYNQFKPESSIHPSWGRDYTENLSQECKK